MWVKGRDKQTPVELTPTLPILKLFLAKQNFLKTAASAELVTRFLTTGRTELAQHLMEQGELPTNAVRLLVDLDVEKDQAALKLLKGNGAFNAVDDAGKTALALAIYDIEGSPVGLFGEPGKVTVKIDRPKALWLIAQGYPIDKVYRENPSGDQTCALNDAIRHGDREILKALLDKGVKLTPETRNVVLPGGRSAVEPTSCKPPLYVAAMFGHRDIAQLLVERGVDVNAPIPKTGHTPLHIAANNNHREIVEFLLSKGANPNAKTIPVVNSDGKVIVETPAQLAEAKGYTEIVKLLKAKQ
jgi:ankyrin repeat protein